MVPRFRNSTRHTPSAVPPVSLSTTGTVSGEGSTSLWKSAAGGQPEPVMATQAGPAPACFAIAPDGTFWSMQTQGLAKFVDGSWKEAARLKELEPMDLTGAIAFDAAANLLISDGYHGQVKRIPAAELK